MLENLTAMIPMMLVHSATGAQSVYSTNNLNQCDSTTLGETESSPLQYDADGNVTQVQTSTGTWSITYNGENRPVCFRNESTDTTIDCAYDSQGRRTEYKSVTNGAQNTWLRFLYDGYLCVQVLYSNEPYNVFKEFVWDPTESVATRPLVFRYAPNSLNLFYAFDGNKNVSDVFYRMNANGIGAHYDYAPFGATTRTHRDSSASFDIVALNPFRFSSEYYDSELDLVYYNYRHYSPSLGRFLSRDPIEEQGGLNLYAIIKNSYARFDLRGLREWRQEDSDCCEGKAYDDKTECCLQGRITSRKLYGYTGVSYYVRRSRFYYIPIYNPLKIEQFFLMHAWFKIGEMRAGSYPGKIDLKEEEYSKLEDSILTFKTDIVLPICKYDIGSFKECVESRILEDAQSGILWEPWANNCRDWIRRVVNDCKFASRRAEK